MDSLSGDARMFVEYIFWFLFCFALFSLLAEIAPNIKGQRLLRKSMKVDLIYWFLMPFFYVRLAQWVFVGFLMMFFTDTLMRQEFATHGLGLFSGLPILVQVGISLLITDMLQYWTHRMFHDRLLWKFHAIHHAPKELDWLSGVRFHPFNLAIHSTMTGVIVYFLGFSPVVFAILAPFNIIYSAFVHANLHWTLGPLRYVFASPIFHRWHHTSPNEGGEKNFAPTFAFLDVVFGTFYMPEGKMPQNFGVREPVPETFWGQMAYPFQRKTPAISSV